MGSLWVRVCRGFRELNHNPGWLLCEDRKCQISSFLPSLLLDARSAADTEFQLSICLVIIIGCSGFLWVWLLEGCPIPSLRLPFSGRRCDSMLVPYWWNIFLRGIGPNPMFGEMSFCLQWIRFQVSGCPHEHVTSICKDFLLDQMTVKLSLSLWQMTERADDVLN